MNAANTDPVTKQEKILHESKQTKDENVADMVQSVLGKLKDQFEAMSSQILEKMDKMGNRMDQLEANLQDMIDKETESDRK